ncbi:MAG: PKD domain-containing protein [Deltaproteobacteria bacterium]|nr:PKD domain-containing protein [Deltaproteobacteria bacterium]
MEASGTITSYDIANQLTGSHKLSSAGTDYEVRFLPIPQKSAPMNMDASNVVIPVEITLEGTGTTFLGEFIFDIDWYFKVEFGLFPFINYAVFKAMPSIKTRLVCSSSVSVSLYKISLSLLPKPIELSPIFVPTPIGVPIMVVPKVDLDLEVQPGVTFQDMKSGLDYKLVNTTGVEYKNFNLSPIFILDQKLTPIYEYTGTQSNTYIRAGISPEIGLYIYNVLGGYFSAGPFFEFEIDPSRDPLLELWFGMGASVGIELEVFTYEVLDIAWNFLETKVLAWEVRLHLPIIKSFFINNNDYETTSREVVLVHTAENEPTFFMASESPSFSGTSWQTYDPSPSITLSPGNGTKTVHFKLKNSAGESAVASDSIELVVEPQVQFYQINNGASYTTSHMVTLNNSVLCNPTEYMASESQSFSAASWKAYSSSPSFTLSSGYGSKTVYFKARNSAGESSVTSDSIDIVGSSVAAFSGSPTSGAAPLSVSFTDQSTNNPTSWSWNFGDGSSSSTRNPSHTYTSAGVYTVTLTLP